MNIEKNKQIFNLHQPIINIELYLLGLVVKKKYSQINTTDEFST